MSLQILELHRDIVRISGDDNRAFLQGQVTCDVDKITKTKAIRGALCNIKGRVIADFIALQHRDDIILQCDNGMGKTLHATLTKYAIFSKVSITLDTSMLAIGLISETGMELNNFRDSINLPGELLIEGDATFTENLVAIRIRGVLAREQLWLLDRSLPSEITKNLIHDQTDWSKQDILCGIAHINESISEQHTPQVLNYDLSHVVDFKKGCYTGQEVVARMHYRGTPKKRIFLLNSKAITGSKLLSSDGSEHKIIAKSFNESGGCFLAVLPINSEKNHTVFRLDDEYKSEAVIGNLSY
jgi:folate-binding protein YgfZ